jgi:hypothetical protein
MRTKRYARIAMALAITATMMAGCQSALEYPYREAYATLRAIKVGATEPDIRRALGEPASVHLKGTPPSVYCLTGRACTDRAVTGRLLVYVRGKPSAYYFLDSAGRVEYVYVGGA